MIYPSLLSIVKSYSYTCIRSLYRFSDQQFHWLKQPRSEEGNCLGESEIVWDQMSVLPVVEHNSVLIHLLHLTSAREGAEKPYHCKEKPNLDGFKTLLSCCQTLFTYIISTVG